MSMWPKFGQLLQEKTGGFKVLDQPIAEKKTELRFCLFSFGPTIDVSQQIWITSELELTQTLQWS